MMADQREYREIPVDEIAGDDETFLISYPRLDEGLCRSLRRVGLLNPLSVRKRQDDRLQIISGFRRLTACLENGVEKVPALIYAQGMDSLNAFGLAVHDNLSRGYNLIEKSNIFHKLINLFHASHDEAIQDYMPLLGLSPGPSLLHDYLSLQNLTEDMRYYIHETDMPLSCASPIASFNDREQDALLKFFRPLRPGLNRLREMLANAEETAAREGNDIADILSRKEFKIISDSDAPRPRKLEMARAALKNMRFPEISAAETNIIKLTKALKLPPDISLRLPPYLEGDTIKAELSFKSTDALRRQAEKLVEVSDLEELKKICGLL